MPSTPSGIQTGSSITPRPEVRIFSEAAIDAMVARHQRINLEEGLMAGYRIQLFASPTLSETRAARDMFMATFPGWSVEIALEEPDFKLLTGAYLDRFDAYWAWQTLVPEYPGSFLVRQLIPVADL